MWLISNSSLEKKKITLLNKYSLHYRHTVIQFYSHLLEYGLPSHKHLPILHSVSKILKINVMFFTLHLILLSRAVKKSVIIWCDFMILPPSFFISLLVCFLNSIRMSALGERLQWVCKHFVQHLTHVSFYLLNDLCFYPLFGEEWYISMCFEDIDCF